jgi:ABC-2 type transport system ATP-binding protein
LITFNKVVKKIKRKPILKNISLKINQGDAIGIVGPNGAGKTTFLKLLATVLKPNSGDILYNGIPYQKSIRTIRGEMGYIPQEIALFEELSVKDQIAFWQKATKGKPSKQYLADMFASLGLHAVLDKKVKDLSGGWKRKLNVCAGLLHDPSIILLDEPTVGVDLAAKDDLLHWLKELHQNGKTLILISHDWDVINHLCDKLVILQEGEVIYYDSVQHVSLFEEEYLSRDKDIELKKILRQRSISGQS